MLSTTPQVLDILRFFRSVINRVCKDELHLHKQIIEKGSVMDMAALSWLMPELTLVMKDMCLHKAII
jgi:hypothetical protein